MEIVVIAVGTLLCGVCCAIAMIPEKVEVPVQTEETIKCEK